MPRFFFKKNVWNTLFLERWIARFEEWELKASATHRKWSIRHFTFRVCFPPSLTSRTVVRVTASSLKPSKRDWWRCVTWFAVLLNDTAFHSHMQTFFFFWFCFCWCNDVFFKSVFSPAAFRCATASLCCRGSSSEPPEAHHSTFSCTFFPLLSLSFSFLFQHYTKN